MRKTKLAAMLMVSLVLLYTACSEKETPQPVEDTARIDALRQELRDLEVKIHGEQVANEAAKSDNASLNATADELQAIVDRLKAQYDVSVNYQVIVIDFQGNPIEGANVTLNQNGEIVTESTGANGVVTFEKVRAGWLTAVASAEGFATANYSTSLYNVNEGGINTRVPLLPKSGTQAESAMFSYTGYLYANLNVADDTLGGYHYEYIDFGQQGSISSFAGDTEVRGQHPSVWHRSYDKVEKNLYAKVDISYSSIPFSEYYEGNNPGTIQELTYEDAIYKASFDATTKKYTLNLPVNSTYEGIGFQFYFYSDEFVASQTRVSVGSTYADGAPTTVDTPKPLTFTQDRHYFFRGDQNSNRWFYSEDIFAGQSFDLNLFYHEGEMEN